MDLVCQGLVGTWQKLGSGWARRKVTVPGLAAL